MKTLVLAQSDIQDVITNVGIAPLMDELIESMHQAFKEFDPDKIEIPVRSGFSYSTPQVGLMEWMPLLNCGKHVLMKMVGYHPENPELNRAPTILSDFSLYCTTTGRLEAILDGTLLTALRTGAASAIASRLLAPNDSNVIGIIGCGAQAITQLHALTRIFPVDQVLYFDIDQSTTESFVNRCGFLNQEIEFQSVAIDQVVKRADILCVATSVAIGAGPVFSDVKTKPHLHINAVGSDFPDKLEVPKTLLQRSYVTPDSRAQADAEGECQQLAPEEIGKELFELTNSKSLLNNLQRRITVFDSTGWVLEDYVVSKLIMKHAIRLGIGSSISIGTLNGDPKNPYEFLPTDKGHDLHSTRIVAEPDLVSPTGVESDACMSSINSRTDD